MIDSPAAYWLMPSETIIGCIGVLAACVFCALSIALLAITDFGQQKASRDLALSMVVLSGLPGVVAVVALVGMCCGVLTGRIRIV